MVRLNDLEAPDAKHLLDKECSPFETAPFVTGPPVRERRVAIVTTAGLHLRDDAAFGLVDEGFRPISGDEDPDEATEAGIEVSSAKLARIRTAQLRADDDPAFENATLLVRDPWLRLRLDGWGPVAHRRLADGVTLDAKSQRFARKANDPHGWIVNFRLAFSAINGQPNLERRLGGEVVKSKSRQQAHDAA